MERGYDNNWTCNARPTRLSCVTCFTTAKSGIVPYKWEPLWHVIVVLTIRFGMNKTILFQSYTYCSHSLHIFSNYIVNMVVCICWIIADCLGVVQKLFGFPTRILYGKPTYMEVYRAAHTFLGGWRPSSRTCSPTIWDEVRHTSWCRYFNLTSQDNTPGQAA